MKLEKLAFELIKDLNNKYPTYNVKYMGAFNKVVKHLKDKLPNVSNVKLGQIALDYHQYRKGDMGRKIPTIKKMAHTMKKLGVKENKLSDKQQYDYLLYMKKYKPGIFKNLQSKKKVRKLMKKYESVNENKLIGMAVAIAKKMSGNMTGAVKKIEKLSKGLSKNAAVEKALQMANESVNETNHLIENNVEMKKIYQLLIKYGNSAKDAAEMIKKNYKYVAKTYASSSPRGKAMALSGLSALGEATYAQMLAKKGKKIKVVMVNGKPQVKIVGINDEPEAVKESDNKFAQKLKARGYIKRGQNERERVKQITKYLEKDANKDFKGAYPSPWVNRLQIPGHGPAQDWWMDTMNSVKRVLGEGLDEMNEPMYKITYQDSNGRKKTDIMRAKNSNLAKRDFNASNKGRGFKILKVVKEGLGDKFSKKLSKYNKKNQKSRDAMKKYAKLKKKESVDEACWVGYKQVGMKDKGGRKVPNCVKEVIEVYYETNGEGHGYTLEHVKDLSLTEAEYQGRKVKLGKIMQGDQKKFKVYVKNPKGNVVKVNFGQGGDAKGGTMRIRKSNPKARASFRARHNCDSPGPRHKARYWSCRKW